MNTLHVLEFRLVPRLRISDHACQCMPGGDRLPGRESEACGYGCCVERWQLRSASRPGPLWSASTKPSGSKPIALPQTLVYDAENRPKDAEPLCDRAIAIFEKQESPTSLDLAKAYANEGNVYMHEGRAAAADRRLTQALEIYRKDPTGAGP